MPSRLPSTRPLILRVVSRMAVGGVQQGILATLARADRERFDYAVLCTKKEGVWADRLRAINIPLWCQKTLPPWDPYQIWRLSRMIRRIGPDLVHIHMAPTVIPAATAARLAGVKHTIIHHHNDYARHWEAQNALLRGWERRLTRRADAVLAVSQAVARCTAEHMGMAEEAIHFTPNGLELERFEATSPVDPRPEWGLAAGTPLVMHVARYLETKRIEDFIEAARWVLADWPEGRVRPVFVAVGGGPDFYRQSYERQIQEMGLQGSVLLAGTRQDVAAILKTAQVGALASEMEGFGQVILEYLAAGLPVAATSLDCIAEMTRDGQEALLSPPRRAERLAANIKRLLLEPELAARLVEAGQRRLKLYDWRTAVRSYEAIYAKALGMRE